MTTTPIATNTQLTSQIESTLAVVEEEDSGGLTADFDTFLQLLTAQLRNQDPLNPLDSSEFVAQLANFSSVEQQTLTNDRLEELISLTSPNADLAQAANWIGLEVAAPGAAAKSDDAPIEFEFEGSDAATSAVLVIRNDVGTAVATRTADPRGGNYSWDGQTTEGGEAPDGAYTAEVTFFTGDTQIGTAAASVFSIVTEVRLENGSPQLLLDNGARISADALSAVRTP